MPNATMDFAPLEKAPRLLVEAELQPVQGHRFQSTGFADLGPARYQLHDGTEMLLVESAQSVANRLESVCWEDSAGRLTPELEGLPYIEVRHDGRVLTNSLLEAHRINSPYILEGADATMMKVLETEAAGLDLGPVDMPRLARTIFKYDANAVLHGVFLAKAQLAGGRLRLPRVLSGFIEAIDVREADSGGVKNDRVNPSGDTQQGFGNVPFHRTEFTAARIMAFFNLDLALLRGYGLGSPAQELLTALSLLKIRRFLNQGLRLRTACDLQIKKGPTATRPEGFVIPDEATLGGIVRARIAACAGSGMFVNPPVTSIRWEAKKEKKPRKGEGKGKTPADESADKNDENT